MSNFQELLDERNSWTLDSDTKLFEKIKNLEFNIFQSAEAIHQSIDEVASLSKNASTALNNSINTFNYMRYTKFVENLIDKQDREHLKKKNEDEEEEEDTIMTEEQEEALYNQKIKESLKLAFDAIGISAKATTDDLISLAENEDGDAETGNATHRRKGLKLPAIYGSKQFEDHLYMGMVEINELEEDDAMPDLLGDDFNKEPEGFGDPFANDANPFDPDDFNPPPANGGGQLFSNSDAPPPPRSGPPPPPPPPGLASQRSGSLPPPPPPPRAQAQNRAQSDANLPGFLRDINALKAQRDQDANLVGDPSEMGSVIYDQQPDLGAQNMRPAGQALPGIPPPPPGAMPVNRNMNPNDSYDPMADESLFIGSNAIKNKYQNNQQKKGIFDDSMMGGGGKGIFDETMRDMSMSMDQDLGGNDVSRIFGQGGKQSPGDNQLFGAANKVPQKSGGLFDKIEEDEEEDKYEEHTGLRQAQPPGGLFSDLDSPETKPQAQRAPARGFLDDTMNEDDETDNLGLRPTPPQPPQKSKGMFEETFDEEDSNASMLFPPKKTPSNDAPQNQPRALPGLTPQDRKPAPFAYGNPPPQNNANKKAALFEDDYEEDESNIFPTKKPTSTGMFQEEDDPNESMIENSRDKSFIDRQKEKRTGNHMMAMIMKGLDPNKQVDNPNEVNIGDDDPVPPAKTEPAPSKAKGPMDYKPAEQKKPTRMFLDESHAESDLGLDLPPTKAAPTQAPPPGNKMLFMEDDEDDDESFVFDKKPKANPAPLPEVPKQNPPLVKKKTFMFDEEESFDEFNMPDKKPDPMPVAPIEQEQKINPPIKQDSQENELDFQKVPKNEPEPEPLVVSQPKAEVKAPPKEEPEMDEQMKKFGFLAMMNPNGGNKPPPAFIRRTVDPTFAAEEQKQSTMRMTETNELDKPIMKKKKRRGKANNMAAFDDNKDDKLPAIPEVKEEAKAEPPKPKVEPPKPKVEPPKPKEPEPVAKPAPAPPAKNKMAFLDDSDDDEDEDDDIFAKKKAPPAKSPEAEKSPAPVAAPAKKMPAMFLDSDDDDDDDSDSGFD